MYVSPFIFVQLSFEDIKQTYQEKEVQGSIWTSLEYLADNDERFFWFRPQKSARYKTDYTLLMPTLLLLNGPAYHRSEVYSNPNLIDKLFPLGGLTMYLTTHMLNFGNLSKYPNSYKKYRNYKVQEIENETLSYAVGRFFSRFAINPHFYLREAWKEYKFIVYLSSFAFITSLLQIGYWKSKKSKSDLKAKI